MARLEYIEHRLVNWAKWKLGRSVSYARPNLEEVVRSDPYAAAPVPVSDVEASETDDAINALPGLLIVTVYEHYLGKGGEVDRLRRLGCAKATMHERIGQAHRLLASWFTNAAERRRTERERVEALQRK